MHPFQSNFMKVLSTIRTSAQRRSVLRLRSIPALMLCVAMLCMVQSYTCLLHDISGHSGEHALQNPAADLAGHLDDHPEHPVSAPDCMHYSGAHTPPILPDALISQHPASCHRASASGVAYFVPAAPCSEHYRPPLHT
jgi:hypothetical protein